MTSRRAAICLSSLLLSSPVAASPAFAEEPAAASWSTDQLIDVLDVRTSRGLRLVDAPPNEAGSGTVSDLRILFDFDSAALTPRARRTLDRLAAAFGSARLHDDGFRIVGHTDAVGDDAYNLELSRRRASSVVEYLVVSRGIDPTRLASEGRGESELFDPGHPTSAANRRVEVVNLRREGG